MSRVLIALLVICTVAACSDSPTTPPTVTPVTNAPPTIASLTSSSARVEAGNTVDLVATVADAETPVNQLGFLWSSVPASGTFIGTGPSVSWRAPSGQTTPNLYTLALKVTENFTSAGTPQQNTVSSSVQVHYNDSPAEMTFLGTDYLVNKFANNNVSPTDAVINFTDSCQGKIDEFNDVVKERTQNNVLSGAFTVRTIDFMSQNPFIDGVCVFEDIPLTGPDAGHRRRTTGICTMHTRYENFRWFLCDSTFSGSVVLESINGGVLKQRVVTNVPLSER